MKSKLFAHSRLDALLVLLGLTECVLLLHSVHRFGSVSWRQSVTAGLASVFLMCTNFQCNAHNFIHNPFFRSRWLNVAFGVFNSMLLGGPQTLYRIHHMHHHKYNNDARDPATATTKDLTSTWRHSAWPDREESFVS
jgi:fatty acid desaturase